MLVLLLLTMLLALVPFIPLPMKVFVLSAGAAGTSPAGFAGVVILARTLRYLGLAYLGAQLGEHSMTYLKDHSWHLLGLATLLFAALYFLARAFERPEQPQ